MAFEASPVLSLPSPTACAFVEGGGEAAPVLLPAVVDKHLQKPYLVMSPTRYCNPRANSSCPVLVPGRKETERSARVGTPSGSHFHTGVAVVWSQLATPGALGLALGCGLCLQIPASGVLGQRPCIKLGLLTDQVRLGLVVYVWLRLWGVGPWPVPCPAPGLGAGFVLRGGAVGAQGALTAEPSSMCCDGLEPRLAGPSSPHSESMRWPLTVSECHARSP